MLVGTFITLFLLFTYPGKFSKLLRMGRHRFLRHLEPLRRCGLGYPAASVINLWVVLAPIVLGTQSCVETFIFA